MEVGLRPVLATPTMPGLAAPICATHLALDLALNLGFRPEKLEIAVTEFSKTPLLDTIKTPDDLRRLKVDQLRQVADELRQETIDAVSVTGGHFGAGLGVVELTTAIHYIFDTPRDRLIWDVGHQAYPHKILTGRRDRIRTLRTGGGLSGFTKRSESDYDPFGAANSSASTSPCSGLAAAPGREGASSRTLHPIGHRGTCSALS